MNNYYTNTNTNPNANLNYQSPTTNMIYAQYGSDMIPANNLALLRGAGAYNSAPNYVQSINRGSNDSKALDVYEWTKPQQSQNQNQNQNQNQQTMQGQYKYQQGQMQGGRVSVPVPVPSFADNIYQTDIDNTEQYEVGTSNFHPEPTNSWSSTPGKYVQTAMASMKITNSALLNFFFSDENVDYLHNRLISEIWRIKNVKIDKQSTDELLVIMRNKYLYAIQGYQNHPGGSFVHQRGPVSQNGLAYTPNGLSDQISLLNKSVLEETVKSVLSGITEYARYYKDASSMPMPLSHPVISSQKGSKALQENLGFESSIDVSNAMSSYNERFNII